MRLLSGGALERPPGRRPDAALVHAGAWYRSLAVEDRKDLDFVIALTARMALHGMLAVLDGVSSVAERPGDVHDFSLKVHHAGRDWELVGPDTPPLHELL